MRKWHRWSATILGAFLAIVAITGIILQLHELEEAGEKREAPAISQTAIADPAARLTEGLAALSANTGKQPAAITVETADGAVVVKARMAGETVTRAWNSASKGITLVQEKRKGPPSDGSVSIVGLAKGIHTGVILGVPGLLLGIIMGAALLFFTISGYVMWWSVAKQRRKIGKPGLFWN